MSSYCNTIQNYALNSSIDGPKHLAEKGRHWSERFFWALCIILCCTGLCFLIHSQLDDFNNKAISFVIDPNYLNWNTKFPLVMVCEMNNEENIAKVADEVFGDPHDYNLDEMIKELVFYKGIGFYSMENCGPNVENPSGNCFKRNFTDYTELVRSPCKDIFRSCKWNNKSFDCCYYFESIETEIGRCFALNSYQNNGQNKNYYPLISNKKTGPGTLYLEIQGIHNLYLIGEHEVPSLTSPFNEYLEISPGQYFKRFFTLKEIDNKPEVKEISIEQRKCRFFNENNLNVYLNYSYSACVVDCRKMAQLNICNCSHHLIPNSKKICNFTGLSCLIDNYIDLTILKQNWASRKGLICNCLPSCEEIEITVIHDSHLSISDNYAIVELTILRLPTEKFQRNVVRGKLDLVVSIGGSTALFLGASILGSVEIVYYFLIRPLSDFIIKEKSKKNKKTIKPN